MRNSRGSPALIAPNPVVLKILYFLDPIAAAGPANSQEYEEGSSRFRGSERCTGHCLHATNSGTLDRHGTRRRCVPATDMTKNNNSTAYTIADDVGFSTTGAHAGRLRAAA
jgi:hypothetical protein